MKCHYLIALLAVPLLQAEDLIVNWVGSGVQGTPALQTEAIVPQTTPGVSTLALDETISWKPAEGFEPNAEETRDFSAGVSASVGASPALPDILQLENRPGGGRIHFLLRGSEADPPQIRGLLAVFKYHFLHDASDPGRAIGFDAHSLLSFTGILDGCAPEARWAVRDGETWYLSENTLAPQRAYQTPEARELTEPGRQKWAEYTPQVPFEAAPQSYEEHIFSDITAVGIWFDSYGPRTPVGGTSFTRFALDHFQVRAARR